MPRLKLDQAEAIIDGVIAETKNLDTKPMAVAVLDEAGQLTAFRKQDGCSLMRSDMAIAKAYASIGMAAPTSVLEERAKDRPNFFDSLPATTQGKFIPVGGANLIRDADGEILGSVGVTGDHSTIDEKCAIAGILSAGFTTDDV
jgi:uncharacterized protein GlcG (DUF336 family)